MKKSEEMLRLERDMNGSQEFREKLEAEMKRIAGAGEAKSDGEVIAKAAAALGYAVTAEELERSAAELEAVDDDELESVAGGLEPYDKSRADEDCWSDYTCPNVGRCYDEDEYQHDSWCLTAWHCTMATLHTESKAKSITCFSDYLCVWVNN